MFFSILKFWFSGFSGGWKGKKWPKITKTSVCHILYSRNHNHMIFIYGTHLSIKGYCLQTFVSFFSKYWFSGSLWGRAWFPKLLGDLGVGMGAPGGHPLSYNFFENPPSKLMPPMGHPHPLKNEAPLIWETNHLKVKPSFRKSFLEKIENRKLINTSGMPSSTELNESDCLVSTRLSYPKQLFFWSAWRHVVNTIEEKTMLFKLV